MKEGRIVEVHNINEKSTIYYVNSFDKNPSWVKSFFKNKNSLKDNLKNSNSQAVYLHKVKIEDQERIFAVTFGYGRYILDDDCIEERFGMITALNLIGIDGIRSINKLEIAKSYKISTEQMPKESNITGFGFDVDSDLINGVTGKSSREEFIEGNITGSDVFRASVPYDIDNIESFLKELYEIYLTDTYKENFAWVDQIRPIKSNTIIDELDNRLLNLVLNNDNSFWMAIPEVVDWENISGFQIVGDSKNKRLDIELDDVLGSFRKDITNINQFKNKYINVIDSNGENTISRFSSYKCFIGELDYEEKSYTISNGKWYEIDKDYVGKVNERYNKMIISNINFIDSNSNTHEKEYNNLMTTSSNGEILNLDGNIIHHGGGQSKIEICDLITTDNQLIHVKKYGASSVLSHLFNQGLVSAQLIKSDGEFINKANIKIADERFKLNKETEYEIVYAIISSHPDELPHIPFFSKISLISAVSTIESMNYKVTIKRINEIKITKDE